MDCSSKGIAASSGAPHALLEVFERLSREYGPQDGWWPADSPFEVAAGAVLTQATSWGNAQMAIGALKRRGLLSASAIRSASPEALANVVRPAGFHQRKARTLKLLAEFLAGFGEELSGAMDESTCSLRRRLLAIHGSGEETADAILLYALGRPTFVADGYARRLFARLGLMPDGLSYADCREYAMSRTPMKAGCWAELHALIVRHGAATCRATPRCVKCPLIDICSTGLSALSGTMPARRPLR